MCLPPYAFCWVENLCHWMLLSSCGNIIMVSSIGFANEDEARVDFIRWHV